MSGCNHLPDQKDVRLIVLDKEDVKMFLAKTFLRRGG